MTFFLPYFEYSNILLIRGKEERQPVYLTPPQSAGTCIYITVLLSQALCRALENCHVRNAAQQYRNTFAKRAMRAQRRGQFFLRHLGWVSRKRHKSLYSLSPKVSYFVFNNCNDDKISSNNISYYDCYSPQH